VSTTAIVIPARLNSSRLPRKPLIMFDDLPMIIHVAKKCAKVFDSNHIYVSTPDREILDICEKFGVKGIKSSGMARSGTDRLSEFSKNSNYKKIINVQGDELLLPIECLQDFIYRSNLVKNCIVGITRIKSIDEFNNKSVVKVAVSQGRMIYASRSPIPGSHSTEYFPKYKHTGLYLFTKESLKIFSNLQQGPLEIAESVEILRFIENRIPVNVIELENYLYSIDTVQDELNARTLLRDQNI
jgi:3-deoxy-manno-octulosonate cytidylyltransferase (CMP-KDO synthetase)